jgi:hypothetical protein
LQRRGIDSAKRKELEMSKIRGSSAYFFTALVFSAEWFSLSPRRPIQRSSE